MEIDFYKMYKPLTASPFADSDIFREYVPCDALKPYVRCFWGSRRPCLQTATEVLPHTLVTPDTCMDIIFTVNFSGNSISSAFCGIDEEPYSVTKRYRGGTEISTFAIRFYAWSTVFFTDVPLDSVRNTTFDLDCYFAELKKEIEPLLFNITTMHERIAVAESFLLRHLHPERGSSLVMQAVDAIIERRGNIKIDRITADMHINSRQLERLFSSQVGIPPKKLASLVRYQYVWNDILFRPDFNILDEVYEYGYTDQAHLLHEFKQYHSMTIGEAKRYALRDVEFLQSAKGIIC